MFNYDVACSISLSCQGIVIQQILKRIINVIDICKRKCKFSILFLKPKILFRTLIIQYAAKDSSAKSQEAIKCELHNMVIPMIHLWQGACTHMQQ